MTIVRHKLPVGGTMREGYQISCRNPECHASNFMPSISHLPAQVVANKFRERGWEVNASGNDACPNCIEKKRGVKKGTKLGPRKKDARIIPLRDQTYLNVANLQKILTGCGFLNVEVVELEHKLRKFKITLKGMPEIALGRLMHAEGEIVESFPVILSQSYLKPDWVSKVEANKVTLEFVTHWYLILEQQQKMVAAQ